MIHWYALYTRPRFEKKIFEQLRERGHEVYLPLVTRTRQWKDRKKKVDMPLFPSYIFVRFDYKYRFDILPIPGVVKIVNFRGEPAVIPDWQIESLKKMMEHPQRVRLEEYMRPGEVVEVTDGLFKGMRGAIKTVKDEMRLVITIEGIMQTVSVELDSGSVKKL